MQNIEQVKIFTKNPKNYKINGQILMIKMDKFCGQKKVKGKY